MTALRVKRRHNLLRGVLAAEASVDVVPVWNKSNREHTIIGSEPSQTRVAADAAVKALGWTKPYFLDADHIGSSRRSYRSFLHAISLLWMLQKALAASQK